ncbi:MAG: hypothetical protein ABSH53_13530 [Holophaga sp.]|jgi:hypothetical protein
MWWAKIPMQAVAILAVTLSPVLKASAPRTPKAFQPCAQTQGLNEGRHRRRRLDDARQAVVEQPVALAAPSMLG